jgi:LysR family hca operon transcriptional activator
MSASLELRYLRYFVAVAETLNFTRAAERLNTVQPSLSQQIRRLEEIIGTPLFWRKKHHLQLSSAGQVFLKESKKILAQADEAIELARKAGRTESGSLTVGFPPGAEGRFASFMHELQKNYSSVQIYLRSLQSPEQLAALRNQSIDVGFIAGPVDEHDIETEPAASLQTVAILQSSHPLAKLKKIPVTKLTSLPLVRPSPLSPAPNRIIDEIAKQNDVKFKTSVQVDNLLATVNAVAAGAGFALVPEHVTYILPKGIVARPLEMKTQPTLELLLAYRKENLSPTLQLFVSAFHDYLRRQRDSEVEEVPSG